MSWSFSSEHLKAQPSSKKLFSEGEFSFTVYDLIIPSTISVLGEGPSQYGIVAGSSKFGVGRMIIDGLSSFVAVSDFVNRNTTLPSARLTYSGQAGEDTEIPQVIIDFENLNVFAYFASYTSESSSILQEATIVYYSASSMSVNSGNLDGDGGRGPIYQTVVNESSAASN